MIPDGRVVRGVLLVGCLVLSACLTLPGTATPRAAATPFPDTPTTQVLSGTATAPAPTTSPGIPATIRAVTAASTDTTTSPNAADSADAARGDAVVLTEALEGKDYAALSQAVSERVAPHADGGAYATALVDALGARGLVRVAAHLPTGESGVTSTEGGARDVPHPALVWTSLLATATASPLWDEGHREALARDLTALVTVTGDLAEPDTLLLPLGFRRLLTANQDPLTAAAGTQAPGAGDGQVSGAGDQAPGAGGGQSGSGQVPGAGDTATPGPGGGQAAAQVLGAGDGQAPGGGQSGSQDPLALDTGFLASLVRGLMAGEAAGGSRVGWVEYARLTTTAGGGYVNFPEDAPREVRARYSSYDPLAAVLTATARAPATVLDLLAPPLPGAAPGPSPGEEYEFRQGRATKVDATTWEWVSARAQESGTACLEALTAAVASASTLRYKPTTSQPNPYEAQAAWLTEQAVVTLAGTDTTTWTPTARRTTAIMLANSMSDVGDAAAKSAPDRGTSLFGTTLPVAWSGHHDAEVTALLREVLTDDTALSLLFKALSVFNAYHIVFDIRESTESHYHNDIYRSMLSDAQGGARLYGYLYSACATGRGVGEGEESPAAGVVLAALDQGPAPWSLDPHTLWQPLADPAQATQATTTSGSSLTQGQLRGEIASRLSLEAIGVLDAVRLIPQDAYTLEDGRPAHDWITLGDDGAWHLDWDRAVSNPRGLETWFQRTRTTQGLSPVNARGGIAFAFTSGTWVARHFDPRSGPGIPPGQTALALLLTAATARLVYGYSHTYQRRAQRHWQHRRARQRRRQERRRRRAQGG